MPKVTTKKNSKKKTTSKVEEPVSSDTDDENLEIEFDDDENVSSESKASETKKTNGKKESGDDELDQLMLQAMEEKASAKKKRGSARRRMFDYSEEEHSSDDEPVPVKKKTPKKKVTKKTTKKTSGKKKGPGRPRKTPKKEPMARLGISDNPNSPENCVEIVYDLPMFIKKIKGFFKNLAAETIEYVYTPQRVYMYVRDHLKNSIVQVILHGDKLPFYYCDGVYHHIVNRTGLDKIFNMVDGDYDSVVYILEKGDHYGHITLTFTHNMGVHETHTIPVGTPNDETAVTDEEKEKFEKQDEYVLSFEFPGKFFKKVVSDIKSMSETVAITQNSKASHLVFVYNSGNKKINSNHTFTDDKKIDLKDFQNVF